jgi:indolepyruvate ferredoxin oxidoreductase alpha subunit
MAELVLLGDEALAAAAVDAGISAAYAYPGTPSSEIMEYLLTQNDGSYIAEWCANEKTSYEAAVGVSYVGKRTLVCMKHVGLNVAADPFMNSAILNIHGGLVLAVADDPGMHSSQNEQDSRYFADFARIICLEPRNQQEVYEMTREAFELSERFHIPVMVRLVTRIAHARAMVKTAPPLAQKKIDKSDDKAGWMLLPSTSRKLWSRLIEMQKDFRDYTENCSHNTLSLNTGFRDFGVITTGLGWNYYRENSDDLPQQPSHLHISAYPVPQEKIRKLAGAVEKIIILEEGYPFVERYLRGILGTPIEIAGKEDGSLPAAGELTPDTIRPALGLAAKEHVDAGTPGLPGRPPQFCAGCPHIDTYTALNNALSQFNEKIVTSDIGCYTLGYLPPFQSIETCLCMGASVGMAKGASQAGYRPVVATIGDSTFLHSGVTPLIDAVRSEADMTLIILDNSTTAMTGGQETILSSSKIQQLVEGIGVDPEHIKLIKPLKKHQEENTKVILDEIGYSGVSVVIALRDCIQTLKNKKKGEQAP